MSAQMSFRIGGTAGAERLGRNKESPAEGRDPLRRRGIPRPPSSPPSRNDRRVTSSITGACAVPKLGMTDGHAFASSYE